MSGVPKIRQWIGDSHSPVAREFLKASLFGPLDVAFIDGDYSEAGVRQDVDLVMPYLQPGAWIIVHDTVPGEGAQRAWLDIAYDAAFRPLAEFIGDQNTMGVAVDIKR